MPIVTDGPMMAPERGIHELSADFGSSIGATASEAWADSPISQLQRSGEIERSKGEAGEATSFDPLGQAAAPGFNGVNLTEDVKPAVPRMDMIEALDRVKKAGLEKHLTLPNQPDMPPAQLDIMMQHAQKRRENEATIERGPQGFIPSALQVGTSFLVGAVDPINVASAFIPVMGELRYGKLLASAGDSVAGRLAIRAGVGGAQGAVGQAALEPLDWWSHTQEGRDFGMADVLHNIMFGAALGGGLHAGGGFISDAYRGAKGRALYPFGPGEPLENVNGTHLPASLLHEDGVGTEALHEHLGDYLKQPEEATKPAPSPTNEETEALIAKVERQLGMPAPPSHAVQIINDLPPRAHEDAMRGTIANLIDGEQVRAGEMLEAAAQTDLRIRESFDAFHGSPHDFERFDLSKIGTGEGAQAYGHGLYFAENERVARGYQRTVSDKAFIDKVATLYDEGHSPDDAWAEVKDHWKDFSAGEQRLMTALEKDDWLGFDYPHQAVSAALRDLKNYEVSQETKDAVRAIGNMYRVNIKAHPEHFIDWDKPVAEQSDHVKEALVRSGLIAEFGRNLEEAGDARGKDIYHALAQRLGEHVDGGGERWGAQGPSVGTKLLGEAGIPGIKYLDQRSRDFNDAYVTKPDENGKFHVNGAGIHEAFAAREQAQAALDKAISDQATRNFVVFNDKDIEITHKNGEPVKREDILPTKHVEAKAPRGRAAADPQTWSLYEFLAKEGGLKPDQELNAIFGNAKGPFVPGFGPLVRQSGRTLDDALRLAKDHGYLFDPADVTGAEGKVAIRDMLDKVAEENSGRKQYRNDQQHATKADVDAAVEREKHEILSALHDEIEASTGQKGVKVDPALEDRVVQIVMKEGEHDVLAAYERAIMEDAERYEGLANGRRNHAETAHIPGWDAPDAGAASRPGEAGAGQRGQAGLSDQGQGRADGGQPRNAGAGHRSPVATELDKAAAWRGLAHTTPDFNTPDIIAKSNDAAKVKPPSTKLDERVAAAEKADAYAQQMYDMFAHRLPEEDRARLQERLADMDRAAADQDFVSQRGAACLFEGGV